MIVGKTETTESITVMSTIQQIKGMYAYIIWVHFFYLHVFI